MHDLKVAVVQSNIFWHDIEANLNMFQDKLKNISSQADIILLPEMFTTGFTMDATAYAETMNGKTVSWMQQMSKNMDASIVGSIIIKAENQFYNRLIWANPDQSLAYYDKRHLFSMANEEKIYSPGHEKLIVEIKGWRICPMICYDLRFPEWTRNKENYDVLLFSASWPEKRISHWRKLLQARAIENQCYTIGVNRTGEDNNDILYNGNSMICNPMGEIIIEMLLNEAITVTSLSYEEITKNRRYMPFLKDQDKFDLII